jgi:hypothetical protein
MAERVRPANRTRTMKLTEQERKLLVARLSEQPERPEENQPTQS